MIGREIRTERQNRQKEVESAEADIERLNLELMSLQTRLEQIDTEIRGRRASVERGKVAADFTSSQSRLVGKTSQQSQLESELNELNARLTARRARARRLRELATLRLHFTGLDVTLCPNCDAEVDEASIERESTHHDCRLCGRPAQPATPHNIDTMVSEAEDMDREVSELERNRRYLISLIAEVREDIDNLNMEIQLLSAAAIQGVSFAFPTEHEERERTEIAHRIGAIQAELSIASNRAGRCERAEEKDLELHLRILNKTREKLRDEAALRNMETLESLNGLTHEVVGTIGAESISDITCSPMGKVELLKHGTKVTFRGIQNQGERLRVKLAFFVTLMRMGREPGVGRHPGLLLIDQPGSSEMVTEDFIALAGVFRKLNDEGADQFQIICATARPEFESATSPDKVFGPQNPPYAF